MPLLAAPCPVLPLFSYENRVDRTKNSTTLHQKMEEDCKGEGDARFHAPTIETARKLAAAKASLLAFLTSSRYHHQQEELLKLYNACTIREYSTVRHSPRRPCNTNLQRTADALKRLRAKITALRSSTASVTEAEAHVKVIADCLTKGVLSVNAKSPNGSTALIMVCATGAEDDIRALLALGADPSFEAMGFGAPPPNLEARRDGDDDREDKT